MRTGSAVDPVLEGGDGDTALAAGICHRAGESWQRRLERPSQLFVVPLERPPVGLAVRVGESEQALCKSIVKQLGQQRRARRTTKLAHMTDLGSVALGPAIAQYVVDR